MTRLRPWSKIVGIAIACNGLVLWLLDWSFDLSNVLKQVSIELTLPFWLCIFSALIAKRVKENPYLYLLLFLSLSGIGFISFGEPNVLDRMHRCVSAFISHRLLSWALFVNMFASFGMGWICSIFLLRELRLCTVSDVKRTWWIYFVVHLWPFVAALYYGEASDVYGVYLVFISVVVFGSLCMVIRSIDSRPKGELQGC